MITCCNCIWAEWDTDKQIAICHRRGITKRKFSSWEKPICKGNNFIACSNIPLKQNDQLSNSENSS